VPIYEFICCSCGDKFDRLVPLDWRSAGVKCPGCGSTELEKAVPKIGGIQSGGKLSDSGDGATCPTCGPGICNI